MPSTSNDDINLNSSATAGFDPRPSFLQGFKDGHPELAANVVKADDWDFTKKGAEPLSLRDAVLQALGGASMCWEHIDKAGVFDSDRAKQIGEKLLEFIEAHG